MVGVGGSAGPFVGRAVELGAIQAAVAAASRGGGPRAVFVHGPPGSGKSRLLLEAASGWAGDDTVRLAGYASESAVALAAVAPIVRAARSDVATGDLLQVFEAADRWLSTRRRTVVVVDDLQWVDEPSRALIHYVVRGAASRRDAAVALVVAARDDPGCRSYGAELLGMLGDGRWTELELGPLSEEQGAALTAALAPDGSVDPAAVYRESGGWPFWLELSCRRPTDRDDAVDRWLREADPDAWVAMGILAVLARPATTDALASILRWPRLRVLAALEQARRRGLCLTGPEGERISHDLLREAVLARHPPAETARLHTMVARHLEATADDDVHALLEAMAHRSQSGLPSVTLAERVLRSPGRRVIGTHGVDALWDVVLHAGDATPIATEVLGQLAALTAELGEPGVALQRWVAVATRLPEGRDRARAWLEASRAAALAEELTTAQELLARSRATASPDEPLCVHWDAQEASIRFLEGDLDNGAALARRALRRTRALPDDPAAPGADRCTDARLHALAVATEAARLLGDPAAIADTGTQLTAVAAGVDEHANLAGLRAAGFGLLMLGRPIEAEAHLRAAWDRARSLALPLAMLDGGFWLVLALHWRGQLDTAQEVLDELVGLTRRLGQWSRSVENVEVAVHLVRLSHGDWQSAVAGLHDRADAERDVHARIRVTYWLASALARLTADTAAEEVSELLARADGDARAAACRRCADELTLRAADALARCGRPDDATAWLARFDPNGMPSDAYLAWWHRRARATIAVASEAADAPRLLAATVERADELDLALEAVWARLDLGRVETDRAVATMHLREAEDRARTMHAATEARLATQALRAAGVRAWRRSAAPDGDGTLDTLTAREREIADLVAAGCSNREVAGRLFVSPKTVESHLSHIFTKLDIRNRVELAALVQRTDAAP